MIINAFFNDRYHFDTYDRLSIVIVALVCLAIGVIQLIKFRNSLKGMIEVLDELRASLKSSVLRKSRLNHNVVDLAMSVSSREAGIHTNIIDGIGASVSSSSPSILLASLAAKFPDLKSEASFREAQKVAVELEKKIHSEIIDLNEEIGLYNSVVVHFPTSLLCRALGYERTNYFGEDDFLQK